MLKLDSSNFLSFIYLPVMSKRYGIYERSITSMQAVDPRTAKLWRQIVTIRADMWDRVWRLKIHPSALFEIHVPTQYWDACYPMLTVFGGDVDFCFMDYKWWDECLTALEQGKEFRKRPPRMQWEINAYLRKKMRERNIKRWEKWMAWKYKKILQEGSVW